MRLQNAGLAAARRRREAPVVRGGVEGERGGGDGERSTGGAERTLPGSDACFPSVRHHITIFFRVFLNSSTYISN
jgi:hypothetical protein